MYLRGSWSCTQILPLLDIILTVPFMLAMATRDVTALTPTYTILSDPDGEGYTMNT